MVKTIKDLFKTRLTWQEYKCVLISIKKRSLNWKAVGNWFISCHTDSKSCVKIGDTSFGSPDRKPHLNKSKDDTCYPKPIFINIYIRFRPARGNHFSFPKTQTWKVSTTSQQINNINDSLLRTLVQLTIFGDIYIF